MAMSGSGLFARKRTYVYAVRQAPRPVVEDNRNGEMLSMLMGSCHCGGTCWTLEGDPGPATACNCTLCRRYGALWAYDYEGERIRLSGPTTAYSRANTSNPVLEIRFCPNCGCVLCWRGLRLDGDGRRRMAVNLRLASPEAVADLPIDHFDGLCTFDDLPRDHRCVRDMWF
jgi:hypothetical protein